MKRGYRFWNHAVKTPISAGRTESIAPTRLAASVCMMGYVQMGVIRYSRFGAKRSDRKASRTYTAFCSYQDRVSCKATLCGSPPRQEQ